MLLREEDKEQNTIEFYFNSIQQITQIRLNLRDLLI